MSAFNVKDDSKMKSPGWEEKHLQLQKSRFCFNLPNDLQKVQPVEAGLTFLFEGHLSARSCQVELLWVNLTKDGRDVLLFNLFCFVASWFLVSLIS